MHIPKCGGTSIHHLIDNNYKYERVAKRYIDFVSPEDKSLSFENIDVFHGHKNVIDRLTSDFKSFTMLREPRSRLISLMNHWLDWSREEILNDPHGIAEIKFEMQRKGFEGFFESNEEVVLELFKNGLSKSLIDKDYLLAQECSNNISSLNSLSDDDLYNKAITSLDKLDFVGLMEEFDSSIYSICDLFCWVPPSGMLHTNRRDSKKIQLSDDLLKKVDMYTSIDQRVYKYGVEKFMKYQQQLYKKYQNKLLEDKLVENGTDTMKYNSGDVNVVEVDLSLAHVSRGFHEREGMDINKIYRWAGQSDESKLYFSLPSNSKNFNVEIHTISRMKDEMFDLCKFYLNGELASSVKFKQRENNLDVFELTFSGVPFNCGKAELCIYSPERISHHDLDSNCPDKRKKSIAVNKIRVIK